MQSDVASRTVTLAVTHDGETAAVDVNYRVAGDGPPAVLLHGIGLDDGGVSWRHALPALAADRRVYALDFPGHGGSEKPDRRYTTAYFRAVLGAFLDELGLDAPALVGVSMGGAVALDHALDHPVERLVLANSYGLCGDAGWRPAAWALLRTPFAHAAWWRAVGSSRAAVRAHLDALTGERPPRELVDDVHEAVRRADVGRTVASWQRSEFGATGLRTDHRDRLADLDAECLFVHGTADPLVPARSAERAAEATGGELALFEGVGHWLPRERPDRFNARVRSFLA